MAKSKMSKLSRDEIKDKIAKASAKLELLNQELDKRSEAAQHDAVDQIDEYLEDTNVSILNLAEAIRKIIGSK